MRRSPADAAERLMTDTATIDALKAYEPELIAIRRDIHRHPETAFEEVRTAALVADRLRSWGIAVTEGLAGTGVVGTLKGKRAGQRAIGLRADLDALHITETPGRAHGSTVAGKMHACGHDGHTTMLLGAARYLAEHPDFGGTVHFIFQPAEEGFGGGRVMVNEGLFDRFPVDAVYGMHNMPGIPVGRFATRTGGLMAAPGRTWQRTPPSRRRISCWRCRRSSAATCRRSRPACSASGISRAAHTTRPTSSPPRSSCVGPRAATSRRSAIC